MSLSNAEVFPLPIPTDVTPPAGVAVPATAVQPFQDELPTLSVFHLDRDTDPTKCRIVLRNKLVRVHAALKRVTPVWAYDIWDEANKRWLCQEDNYLGPILIVRRKRPLIVTYENHVCGTLPMAAVRASPEQSGPGVDPLTANRPGQLFGFDSTNPNCTLDPNAKISPVGGSASVYAWAVTHLHGGRSAAMYDGWTENAMLPPRTESKDPGSPQLRGQTQLSVYENDQRACMLWYHDHGMGITRFNVYAGLAGAYIVRDPDEEQRLAKAKILLPADPYDIPLIIQDRNLDGDLTGAGTDDGKKEVTLNGKLLHKSSDATAEFFGPYTLVNGMIWPRKSVERRRYRFRLLNGSNARTYCLKLITSDASGKPTEIPWDQVARQIGTDGGLLPGPVKIPSAGNPTDGLVLAPSERAELYIDFSQPALSRANRVVLVNTAFAPFHRFTVDHPDPQQAEQDPTTGAPVPANLPAGTALPGMRLPYPTVMCFDLGNAPASDPATDLIGNSTINFGGDFQPVTHDDLPEGHGHRTVVLVESPPGMLMMFEMAECTPGQAGRFIPLANGGPISVVDSVTKTMTMYVPLATRFEDRVTFFPRYGYWEVWNVLNLTADTHPFHVHLVQFKVLHRQEVDPDSFNLATFSPLRGISPAQAVTLLKPIPPDANETGWKDSVRVNPGEMVAVTAKFDGFTGRYMYHCHILEHEDHEMMRPFVVTPKEVMAVMDEMGDMPMLDGTDGMPGM